MPASPHPDVVVGRHPDHGVVAANPSQHHVVDWYLEHLGFRPAPDDPGLHVLDCPPAEAITRTADAVGLMRRAGLTVHTDLALEPFAPDPVRATEPEVAFAEHPRHGIIAAISDTGSALDRGAEILLAAGWRYQPDLDVYTLPARLERHAALAVLSDSVRALGQRGHLVAVHPRLASAALLARGTAPTTARPALARTTNTATLGPGSPNPAPTGRSPALRPAADRPPSTTRTTPPRPR